MHVHIPRACAGAARDERERRRHPLRRFLEFFAFSDGDYHPTRTRTLHCMRCRHASLENSLSWIVGSPQLAMPGTTAGDPLRTHIPVYGARGAGAGALRNALFAAGSQIGECKPDIYKVPRRAPHVGNLARRCSRTPFFAALRDQRDSRAPSRQSATREPFRSVLIAYFTGARVEEPAGRFRCARA